MNTDPGRSPSIVTSIADWGNLFKGRVGPVCVKKFSVKPSSQYRYSFMSESEECRAWARRGRTTGGSPDVRISDPNQEWSRCVPLARGKGPASAGRGSPPGSRRIDVYSYKVPARPEAKSALQGRGTGLARWWGHEVLKGPNTIFPNLSHVLPSFSGQNGEISL